MTYFGSTWTSAEWGRVTRGSWSTGTYIVILNSGAVEGSLPPVRTQAKSDVIEQS